MSISATASSLRVTGASCAMGTVSGLISESRPCRRTRDPATSPRQHFDRSPQSAVDLLYVVARSAHGHGECRRDFRFVLPSANSRATSRCCADNDETPAPRTSDTVRGSSCRMRMPTCSLRRALTSGRRYAWISNRPHVESTTTEWLPATFDANVCSQILRRNRSTMFFLVAAFCGESSVSAASEPAAPTRTARSAPHLVRSQCPVAPPAPPWPPAQEAFRHT